MGRRAGHASGLSASAGDRLRIGVLTLDWPPVGGGMARFCVETFAELARRGHEILCLAGRGAESPVAGVRVVGCLNGDLTTDRAALRRFDDQVDVWHAWELGYGGLAHLTGSPMVVTVHGNDLFRPKAYFRFTRTPVVHRLAGRARQVRWQRRLCMRGLRRVACFTPNSRNTARLLREHYGVKSRVEVVPCGVSDRFLQPRETGDGPPRLLTVCTLTRLRPRKNVRGVIEALGRLRESHDFVYEVCGDGDMVDELRALARSLGLGDRVRFHGNVSDDELLAFYRRADLFVLTPHQSAEDVEGFGIVYLEANAAGTPVLATPTGGVPDAVCDGVSGYFARSADAADLADALRRFLSGGMSFDEGAVRAWARRHDYAAVADRCEAVYRAAHPPRAAFRASFRKTRKPSQAIPATSP